MHVMIIITVRLANSDTPHVITSRPSRISCATDGSGTCGVAMEPFRGSTCGVMLVTVILEQLVERHGRESSSFGGVSRSEIEAMK